MANKVDTVTFDPTFGTRGIKFFNFDGSYHIEATAIAINTDGDRVRDIYVAGNYFPQNPSKDTRFWLTRLDSQGTIDPDFARNSPTPGFVFDAFEPFVAGKSSVAKRLSILNNTDVLVTGEDYDNYTGLARYLRSGSPNLAFGTNGKVVLKAIIHPPKLSEVRYTPRAIELPNGQFVVSSTALSPQYIPAGVIYRLNADGSPDKELKGQGYFRVERYEGPEYWIYLDDLVIEPDGKLVAFGITVTPRTTEHQIMFVRYTSEGDLDTSYADGGYRLLGDLPYIQPSQLIKRPDGRLVGIGCRDFVPTYYGLFFGVTKDGSMDMEFNKGEPLKILLDDAQGAVLTAGALDSNGNLVVGGHSLNPADAFESAVVARLLPTGELDPTFNGQGWTFLEIGAGPPNSIRAVAMQPDGKLLIAGACNDGAFVARLIV